MLTGDALGKEKKIINTLTEGINSSFRSGLICNMGDPVSGR